jgi:hypothetical protein
MPPISFEKKRRKKPKRLNETNNLYFYFSFTKKEKEEKKRWRSLRPGRRGGGGVEAVGGGKGEIGADVCGFGPHFIFVLRRQQLIPLNMLCHIELNLFFFSPDGHFTQKIIISPRLAFSNGLKPIEFIHIGGGWALRRNVGW